MASGSRSRPRAGRPANSRAAREAAQHKRRRIRVAAVSVVALAVLAVVGTLAFRGGSSTTGFSADQTAFRLPALTGPGQVSLAAHAGRPVVVNFFASWCVYCNEELPGFVQVAKATRGRVDFIGVDTDDTGDGAAMARRFDLAGAGFSLARDIGAAPAADLWRTYGSQGLPVTAFYDAHGKLVDFSGGLLEQAQLEQRLKADFGVDVHATNAATLAAPVIPLIPRGAFELLRTQVGNPAWVPLDLRSRAQFTASHVPYATNLDASSPSLRAELAKLDTSRNYVLYSQTGRRSADTAALMHQLGFKHVYDVQGGFAAWQSAGLPVTR